MWLLTRHLQRDLNIRDGFVATALFWLYQARFEPYRSGCHQIALSPTEAIFESISGLTTTGATVITGLDELPRSLLFTGNSYNG